MSVPEAGKLLGLGRSAAYAAVRRGDLPVLKFGERLRVSTATVHSMLTRSTGTVALERIDESTPSLDRMERGLGAVRWLLALDPNANPDAPAVPAVPLADVGLVIQQAWELLGPEVDLGTILRLAARHIRSV